MSEDIKNIAGNILRQIHQGKIKMKPRAFFILGSTITFIGLILTIFVSTFLLGLIKFSLRAHGPMADYRLDQMLMNFPWLTLVLAVLGLVIGIWLIRQYDFSYKVKPWIVMVSFIIAIIIAGVLIDTIGINDKLLERGPVKGIMRKYTREMEAPMFLPPPLMFNQR